MPRQSLDGKRTHVVLTKYQIKELHALCKSTGLTMAEHMRRALDFYLASISDRLATRDR